MFILKVFLIILPLLFRVAYVTVAERKTMASLQKNLGFKPVWLLQVLVISSNIIRAFTHASQHRKFIIFSLLDEHINIYLKHFRFHYLKYLLNHSWYQSLDLSVDSLIVKIYNDVRSTSYACARINPWIFFILSSCIYMFLGALHPSSADLIFIYLSYFIFLIGICIQLIVLLKIWIENTRIKAEFPLVYYIIKYFLLSLCIINLYTLIIVGEKIWLLIINYLKKLFYASHKSHILTKLKDMKLSLEYKLHKSPKNPKNPENKSFWLIKDKKKDKKSRTLRSKKLELKKRAEDLKNKVLDNQRGPAPAPNSLVQARSQRSGDVAINIQELSLRNNRNWKGRLAIDKTTEFSIPDQINYIHEELEEYERKIAKFKKVVINIDKGKENFYPEDSRSLFNNYIDIIENKLLPNLKSQRTFLKKNLDRSKKKISWKGPGKNRIKLP